MSSKKNNNILKKLTYSKEFRAFKKDYAILIWASTYWSENNFVVRIIEETLGSLREKNIAYNAAIYMTAGQTIPNWNTGGMCMTEGGAV